MCGSTTTAYTAARQKTITSEVIERRCDVWYHPRIMNTIQAQPVGNLLREWRQRRRMSQLDLAAEAEISSKHLSFLETGRSLPSREMLLHLAEQLAIPLRERNILLVAAGYAPVFPERSFDDPALQVARKAVGLVLAGHEPSPALAVDRHWTLIASNNAIPPLLAGADAALLQPPVNVLRLSLHPAGLAPRIANLPEWRAHLLARLRQQIDLTADPLLVDLMRELLGYPVPGGARVHNSAGERSYAGVVVPFQLNTEAGRLTFFSTTTIFGTPIDITLSELAIESFFPADALTAAAVRRLAQG
jgi:transcriptional regulator with XRE-family HTH domain